MRLLPTTIALFLSSSLPRPSVRAVSFAGSRPSSTFKTQPICRVAPQMSGMSNPEQAKDSVIRYWFGDDFFLPDRTSMDMKDYLRSSVYAKRWWSGAVNDREISEKFTDVIRAVGKNENLGDEWEDANGHLARIILFDQLSRNAFRGLPEAFAYDHLAVQLSRNESLADHDLIVKKLEEAVKDTPDDHVLRGTLQFELTHRAVIERFGRYPHRNKHFGRVNTPEEAEWLASPNLPGWAKSQ